MLSTFINIVIGISVTIGFIVIFQAMYTAVMERTREIGILKSLGASKFYIVNVILRETTVLAIAGIVLGIAISFAASTGIQKRDDSAGRYEPCLDRECRPHRHCRRARRRTLPRLQSRAERPD